MDHADRYEEGGKGAELREEDFRRTLFWSPNVTTDRRGHATIEFYNNSYCQQLVFSADGIGPDGTPLLSQ